MTASMWYVVLVATVSIGSIITYRLISYKLVCKHYESIPYNEYRGLPESLKSFYRDLHCKEDLERQITESCLPISKKSDFSKARLKCMQEKLSNLSILNWTNYYKLQAKCKTLAIFLFCTCAFCACSLRISPLKYMMGDSSTVSAKDVVLSDYYNDATSLKSDLSSSYSGLNVNDYLYDTVSLHWVVKEISLLDYLKYCATNDTSTVIDVSYSIARNTVKLEFNGILNAKVMSNTPYYLVNNYSLKVVEASHGRYGTVEKDPFRNFTTGSHIRTVIVYNKNYLYSDNTITEYTVISADTAT